MNNKALCLLLGLLSFACVFGCEPSARLKARQERPVYTSYQDIPGVTEEETAAIEKFRAADRTFVFGMNPSTEFFTEEDGTVGGYSVLFCEWLSTLFGITFKPVLFEWDDLLAGLESGAIDFTGEMTATEERRAKYFMTDTIAERTIKFMRLKGEDPLPAIEKQRPLRYAFLEDTTTHGLVSPFLKEGSEYVFVGNYEDVYRLLEKGLIDAFFDENPAESAFDDYGDVVAEDFFPLLYSPVSLTTQNQELKPIISAVQKVLKSGGAYHLTQLYNRGYIDYLRHKFFSQLTAEEKEYIREHLASGLKIPVAMEYDNYPASFYNEQENKWQGIAIDVLKEVEKLTGLAFVRAQEGRLEWPVLLGMLERGEAAMATELIPSKERRGRFLWPDNPYQVDFYALLSRADYPDIRPNEILYAKVGLIEDSVYAEIFREWFPNHPNVVEYTSNFDAFDALERGDVDLLMMTQNQLLSVTNFLERPGFKSNILFNRSYEASFGLNIKESVLCSIMSKALPLIDIHSISQRWTHRLFDYRLKMAQAKLPWLIGVSTLLLCVLLLVFAFFQRKRGEGKKLEVLVERRTAEQRQILTKLEAVTGNYKGIIWSVDKDGIITIFNGRYLETIGVTPSFLEGKKLELARSKNRHLDIIYHVEKTFREGPQDWTGEVDGSMFHSCTMPIRDGSGETVGVVGSTDDVTQMFQLQRDLEDAVEAAKAASQAKSEFLANMSHEIRTPMNAIMGLTHLALQTDLNEQQYEYVHRTEVSAKALLRIINDILDFSKIEAGKLEMEETEFHLGDLMRGIMEMHAEKAHAAGLEFALDLPVETPFGLLGDPVRLAQVINNLIGNAIKFTGQNGTVIVRVATLETTPETAFLRFTVEDSGIGLSPEQAAKLFNPFTQADATTTRKYGGTGLGLAISKRLAEMMGGEIWCRSEPGRGSTFGFTARFKPCVLADAGPPLTLDSFKGLRVLAVDDNAQALEILSQLMSSIGFTVVAAGSGEEALKRYAEAAGLGTKFDLIVVDWQMPDMDGGETVQRLAESWGPLPAVLMITGYGREEVADSAKAANIHNILTKPISLSSLNTALLEVFGKHRAKHGKKSGAEEDDLSLIQAIRGARILLAEDNEVNQLVASRILTNAGFEVMVAGNGQEALDLAQKEQFDLILMDIQMPEMDGLTATTRLRAMPQFQNLPIVAMTAHAMSGDREQSLKVGMNDHITKPINISELFQALARWIPPRTPSAS